MPLYILILVVFGVLTGGILFFRHIWLSDLGLGWTGLGAIMAVILALLPLLLIRQTPVHLTRFDRMARHILYAVYVCALLLLCLTLIADVVCIGGVLSGLFSGGFCLQPGAYNFMLAFTAVAVTVTAVFGGLKMPSVKRVILTSPKIKQPVKIAVLSDMHLTRTVSVERVRGIVARTNAARPDIVVLTGDIVDDAPGAIAPLLAPLKDLQAPRWFVTGNHEFYSGYEASIHALMQTGARFLENNGTVVNGIFLGGIPDKTTAPVWGISADIAATFASAPRDMFRVLLSHTPLDVGTHPPFDLEIAGHTHGGQVWPFHILARLGNAYLAGLYRQGSTWVYVSRGAGQWGPQMRFLAPAEITLIELNPV